MNFSTTVHGGGSEGSSGDRAFYMGWEYDDQTQTEMLEENATEKTTK